MNKNITIDLTEHTPPHFRELVNKFMKDEYSNYWLSGGRGSTKSTCISCLIVVGILTGKNTHAVCLRKHKVQLNGSVYSQIIKVINMLGVEKLFKISNTNIGAPPIVCRVNDNHIYFCGADDPEGIKSITPRSGYLKYSWFEELNELSGMDKVRSIRQSIRRGSDQRFVTFYSYNPPRNKTNWVNAEKEHVEKDPNFYVSHSTWEDLPKDKALKWLGKDFINDALTLKSRDEESYIHEYLGIPIGYGTNVFKNIINVRIKNDDLNMFDNSVCGLDWGFSNDSLAWTRSHYDRRKRELWIYDEIYGVNIFNSKLAELLKIKLADNPREIILADSASPKDCEELRREYGFNVIKAKKGAGSRESGVRFLQSLNKIIIDKERCPNTWREFNNAEFAVDRNGNILGSLQDKDDHTIDSVRYRLTIEQSNRGGWNR